MFTKWWTARSSKRAAALLLGCALAVSGCSLLPAEQVEEQLPTIAPPQISKKPEYEVTTQTLETRVEATGKLISMREETLYYTIDGKRLKELYIERGQKVKAGDPIASLDVEDLQKQVRDQKLQFRKEEVAMKETLRKKDEMPPVDFEAAVIAFEEKRQAIADLEKEISQATLTAPFSGTVVQLPVQKGDAVKAYDPICVIADTSQLTPAIKLEADELEQVTVGMKATVEINGAGTANGKVQALPVPKPDEEEDNGGIGGGNGANKPETPDDFLLVKLDKMPANVARGTMLSVSIIVKSKPNAIVIPPSALRSIGSRTYVQVVEGETKREVDVEVGEQTATVVEILKGLEPGMKVVGR
ncbi:biotin/lipoyl-binding protein [Paenibacillus pasadenensis]|uniref:efflux RND transporter periplasmic adaptor subunit n=1 Tax=Paenibacillus pasadenensis TaxID=217090 RepID=UPI00203EF31B|nr:biotin/lipoyl-binding protein [Paenibacillus pasadenensis]MCM3746249.1 biotin/lipoyl-binding protein [Paenibacillus pasadenensis]